MSENAPTPAPEIPKPEAPKAASKMNPQIAKAINSFVDPRLKALKEGGKDLGSTAVNTFKEYVTVDKSKGSPSILGIIKGTSKAVWDTISWKSNRGLLNFKGTSLNPFNKEKKFALNPMEGIKKTMAGATLTGSKLLGGSMGLVSEKLGNAVEEGINATSRMVGGVITGDYGDYMKQG